MRDDPPIIQRKGWAAFIFIFVTLIIIHFSFFGLADRAELFFANETINGEVDGLILEPTDERWPSWGHLRGIAAIIFLALIPSFTAVIMNRNVNEEGLIVDFINRTGISGRRSLTIVFSVASFWVVFLLFISIDFGIGIIGSPLSSTLELVGYIIVTIAVGAVITPFTYSLVPHHIRYSGKEAVVDRYLSKQWRYAQALLSGGIAIVVAGFIPAALSTTDWFGYTGLVFLVGTLLPPFLITAGYLAYRIHVIEVAHRI